MSWKNLPWILSVILLIAIIGQHFYFTNKSTKTIIVTDSVIIKPDSIPYSVTVPAPYPVFKDTGSAWIQIINTEVDTFAIIRDYLIKNAYHRVFKDDSSALVIVDDTVSMNKLHKAKFTFQNRQAKLVSHYIKIYPDGLFLGGSINTDFKNVGLSVNGTYVHDKSAYSVEWDFINHTYQVGYGFNILRK
jgi:hypothetical protein